MAVKDTETDTTVETDEGEVTEPEAIETEGEPEVDAPVEVTRRTNWQAKSRKWEQTAKKKQQAIDELEAKVRDREAADQSEHEKAIQAAREEGEQVATTKAEKERRADRLENASIRLAATGFKVKEAGKDGEETVKTLRFADPDDAHTYIERMLRRGDLDEADIFDDAGKIQKDGLTDALIELLQEKPHLAAPTGGDGGGKKVVTGTADGGKGSSGAKESDDLTPAEWLKRIQKRD